MVQEEASLVVGPFYCILCPKAKEDLDGILARCEFASFVLDSLYQMSANVVSDHKDASAMIEEFLLNPLCVKKTHFFWLARGVCYFLGFVGQAKC